MVRIAVFLSNNEQIFLLLFVMISQVYKPLGTLQCWKFSLNLANSAAVFSYLFVLLERSSPHVPRIHDQGLLVPGLSENTNSVYLSNSGKHVISREIFLHIALVCERLPSLQSNFGFRAPFEPEIRQILDQKSVFGFAERNTPEKVNPRWSNYFKV